MELDKKGPVSSYIEHISLKECLENVFDLGKIFGSGDSIEKTETKQKLAQFCFDIISLETSNISNIQTAEYMSFFHDANFVSRRLYLEERLFDEIHGQSLNNEPFATIFKREIESGMLPIEESRIKDVLKQIRHKALEKFLKFCKKDKDLKSLLFKQIDSNKSGSSIFRSDIAKPRYTIVNLKRGKSI